MRNVWNDMPVQPEYPTMRERVMLLDRRRIAADKLTRKEWLERANVDESTWYVWMDVGRGITPSERIVLRLEKALAICGTIRTPGMPKKVRRKGTVGLTAGKDRR